MKVAITGASGHIGNCLVRQLKDQGAEIKVLVHSGSESLDDLDPEIIRGDLLESSSLDQLCRDAEIVFHLAAQIVISNKTAKQVFDTNVTGTRNILKASMRSGVKRFIHFSSIHAYRSEPGDQILDETRPRVETGKCIYEFSKAEGEREVLSAVKEGLDAVILNPTAVIGPFDYNNSLLGQAIRKIYLHRLPFMIDAGYNWVDVRDVAASSVNAIEYGRRGENYILGGHYYSLGQLSKMISLISGSASPFKIPISLARFATPFFGLYARSTGSVPLYTKQSLEILVNSPVNISDEKARKELRHNPRPLNDTLTDTIEWYKKNKILS